MANVPIIGKPMVLLPGLSKRHKSLEVPVMVLLLQAVGGVVPLAEEKSSFSM